MELKEIIKTVYNDKSLDNLTLLQIGANDGLQSDPFRDTIITYKITSHLLEPIPELYEILIKNYKEYKWVNCHNLAITNLNGEEEITYVPVLDNLPEWTRGLGTFDSTKNFIGANGMGGHKLLIDMSNTNEYKIILNNIKKIFVKTKTLKSFIESVGIQKIDIYVTDTEGFDWVIFNQLDLNKFTPKIIWMETHTLGDDQNKLIDEKLLKYNYTILTKEWNTIAVKYEN